MNALQFAAKLSPAYIAAAGVVIATLPTVSDLAVELVTQPNNHVRAVFFDREFGADVAIMEYPTRDAALAATLAFLEG